MPVGLAIIELIYSGRPFNVAPLFLCLDVRLSTWKLSRGRFMFMDFVLTEFQ